MKPPLAIALMLSLAACNTVIQFEDGGASPGGGGEGAAGPGPSVGGAPQGGAGPGGSGPGPSTVTSGVGAGAPTDEAGDVERPEADVVESDVRIVGELVDLRVRFLATPFPDDMTQELAFCIDTDESGATGGSCGMAAVGIDQYVIVDSEVGPPQGDIVVLVGDEIFDACEVASFDASTNTLRLVLPLDAIDDDPPFRFILSSNFGGSGGKLDNQPPPGSWFESVEASSFLPWSGTPVCF